MSGLSSDGDEREGDREQSYADSDAEFGALTERANPQVIGKVIIVLNFINAYRISRNVIMGSCPEPKKVAGINH